MKKIFFIVVSLWLAFNSLQAQITLEPFTNTLSSNAINVRDMSVSADGNEMYFTVESFRHEAACIVQTKKQGKKWTKPEIVSFSGKYRDIEPFLSSNGLRMYFSSNRPINNSDTTTKDYDIWYVDRASLQQAWSAPVRLDTIINSTADEYYPSVANNGNIYFTAQKPNSKGKEDIWVSNMVNGKYSEPQSLSDSVNSVGYEFNAFVAPDESYIIFTAYRRADDLGGGDLYISHRSADGSWKTARHFDAPINSNRIDYCPFVDAKNNRLYFTSERNSIPPFFDKQLSIDQFLNQIQRHENGLGRIYSIDLNKHNVLGQ